MSNLDLHVPIYVAGHRGMVGSAIVRALEARGHTNLVTRTFSELD
ncbi:MAG: NAD-dependent epimerase/dehydratase family protein, partial [Flavobacteriales bacterium]